MDNGPKATDFEGWQGGIDMAYRIGPSAVDVKLHLNMTRELTKITNIVGTFPGVVEAEKQILLGKFCEIALARVGVFFSNPRHSVCFTTGSHRDAWSFGGADPHR